MPRLRLELVEQREVEVPGTVNTSRALTSASRARGAAQRGLLGAVAAAGAGGGAAASEAVGTEPIVVSMSAAAEEAAEARGEVEKFPWEKSWFVAFFFLFFFLGVSDSWRPVDGNGCNLYDGFLLLFFCFCVEKMFLICF